jgi:cell division protein FtsA
MAGTSVSSVWLGASGAGLASRISQVEIDIGGRRIEEEDIEQLLGAAKDAIRPDGRMVLHAQPACYFLDGADGVANPKGLHAERLGVDIHTMLADGAPMRNLREAVENAHLEVEGVVASPLAAGYACLSAEERDLGVALVEFGAEVTNVAVFAGGMLVGLTAIPLGSGDITDAIASHFGIRRTQAERIKCLHGSAIASPADHRERVPVSAPGEEGPAPQARGADDQNRIARSDLIAVVTGELDRLVGDVGRALEAMGFAGGFSGTNAAGRNGTRGRQVVLTGGGAEMVGLADYAQAALGRPVRIGKAPHLKGLPEAHAVPGFATLAGLVLYAAEDPVDIRVVGHRHQITRRYGATAMAQRLWHAMKEYF